ncbi:5'-flap endonuclease [Paecilomyces lecythidis]
MAATTELVILPSSSPAPIFAQSPTPVSYSPERLFDLSPRDNCSPSMLSPSALFKSSSNSARVQSRRSREGFTGGDLQTGSQEIGEENVLLTSAPRGGLKEKPKRTTKKGTQGEDKTAEKTRKPAEAKKRQKRDTSKQQEKGNMILKGRVAKPSGGKASDFDKVLHLDLENTPTAEDDWEKDLQLEVATKRRLDWTPTKDSKKSEIMELSSSTDANGDDVEGLQVSRRRGFGNLLSTYGFDGESRPVQDIVPKLGDEGPTKRRRIELVDPNVFTLPTFRRLETTDASSGESATETAVQHTAKKPRKKKMTTITAHATARYDPSYEGESSTISRYLVIDEDQSTTRKSTETSKMSKSKTKKNKDTKERSQQFTVVHPEAAFRSLEDQDLLFGTCSQLEREESPTFIREIQKAIRASEADVQVEEGYQQTQSTTSNLSGATTVSRFTGSRNLWSAAARDSSGSLIQAEVVDLVDSPDVSRVSSEILQPDTIPMQRPKSCPQDNRTEPPSRPVEITEIAGSMNGKSQILQPANHSSHTSESNSHLNSEPTRKPDAQAAANPETPHFAGLTDAELSKQIASYGFKPVKGRKKMIELLQKCWESRQSEKEVTSTRSNGSSSRGKRTESHATGNKPETGNSAKPSKAESADSRPKRTVGRKKEQAPKSASKHQNKKTTVSENQEPPKPRFQNVEEIEDSEEELIPSPSRMWNRYISRDATPTSLPLSAAPSPARKKQKGKIPPHRYTDRDDFSGLSTKLMEAIRSQSPQPSVNGHPCPTWHEKILMYDPIVLEDLATWLNTEGLNLVGEDREVSPSLVRKWCESHGICCCWKKI